MVQLKGEQTEELYTLVATTKPQMKVINYDILGDGTTKTIEIEYPKENENITNYYSLDNGVTWNVYIGEIDVPNIQRENVLAKIEYSEGTTINKPVSYSNYIDLIKFGDLVWKDGKASIEISSLNKNYIEYQVNSDTGTWQSGTKVEDLQFGDIVYARINDGTNIIDSANTIVTDNIAPEEFTIQVTDITYKSLKISGNTQDKQSGIKSYTYVVQKDGSIVQEIADQTVTGLSEKTEYTVYMLAYDNAGNVRKSNEVTITTPEYVPPQASAPSTGSGTYRAGNQLSFTWEQLAEIAKAIANNSEVTSNTNELTITYEGTTYTIGVGDYKTINGKKVRILGFNHDTLVDKTVYKNEDGSENTYAGISFEYVDFMIEAGMNSTATSVGGWAASDMYKTLNTTQYNNLPSEVKVNIKQVKKAYCATYNSATLSYSNDYLWLLSCAEIWATGSTSTGKGYSIGTEGLQYKYYKNINATYSSGNNYLKKPSYLSGTDSNGKTWWLRTPSTGGKFYFCSVFTEGECRGKNASESAGISPGFSI